MSLRDDILAAIERLMNEKPKPHMHVVHPRAIGWAICADCGQPLYIEPKGGGLP